MVVRIVWSSASGVLMLGAITNPSGRLSSAPSTAPSVEMISYALGAVGRRIVSIRALKALLAQCKGNASYHTISG